MMIAMIIIAALLVFLGWGVHKKKWYFLISGYNTMTKEQQQQVEVEKLAKSVAQMSYIIAVLLILLGVFAHYELWTLLTITTGLIVVVPFAMIFKTNKYYKNVSQSKITKKISTIITVVTLIVVGIALFSAMRPTSFTVENESLTISGMYGEMIAFDEITQVELLQELPDVGARTNGSSLGSKLKGNFKMKNGEKAKLFVDQAKPPFIKLQTESKTFYFNETEAKKTEQLFKQLSE